LNKQQFKDIEDEAQFEGMSEPTDMNRLVSYILRNRKIDPSNLLCRKRRQRLSLE